ncbi:MAG: insulinase family protein [Vicinamibacterales bacterium]
MAVERLAHRRGADSASAAAHRARSCWLTSLVPPSRRSASAGSACHASTRDYATLDVLNTILGGSFTSHVSTEPARGQHGYACGRVDVRHALVRRPFFATAGVQTDKTAEALKEFFVELDGIGAAVPAEELSKAKNYVAHSGSIRVRNDTQPGQKLEQLVVFDLPDDTYRTFIASVEQVTAADVRPRPPATSSRPRWR